MKPLALGGVEPFDDAGHLDEVGAGFAETCEGTERAIATGAAMLARRQPPRRTALSGNSSFLDSNPSDDPITPDPTLPMQPATLAALESRVLRECSHFDATQNLSTQKITLPVARHRQKEIRRNL